MNDDTKIIPLEAAMRRHVFNLEPFAEIEVGDEPEWLVQGIIPATGFGVIYGEPGCGKSFVATDLGLHIAQGLSWAGKEAISASVVYICAEGATGFRKRLVAYREHHGTAADLPFYLVDDCPDLGKSSGDVEALLACINEVEPGLVIIDTLARTMMGGDENSATDMGAFVTNCDRIARHLNCMVLAVHHSGKDRTKGARGSSALKGAADVELYVADDSYRRTATVSKQKDGESGLELAFNLQSVEFEAHGRQINSCVVNLLSEWSYQEGKASKSRLTDSAQIALNLLHNIISENGRPALPDDHCPAGVAVVSLKSWRNACDAGGVTDSDESAAQRQAFNRAKKALVNQNLIGQQKDLVWLVK